MPDKKTDRARGALGMLLESEGKIQNIPKKAKSPPAWLSQEKITPNTQTASSTIKFSDKIDLRNLPKAGLLIEVKTSNCQLWKYADRQEDEMGNIDELASSIEHSSQLEPILVRPTSTDGSIPLEIIFGNRRWRACDKLGKPVIAILKDITDQQAALMQKEENAQRKNVSDFSRAFHYKKLLDDGIFKSATDIAQSLSIPKQTLNNLLAFTRIPKSILDKLTHKYTLSQQMALRIVSLAKNANYLSVLGTIAPEIGSQPISSPQKLEAVIKAKTEKKKTIKPVVITNDKGDKLFTLRKDSNGSDVIILHKNKNITVPIDKIIDSLKNLYGE